MRVTIQQAASNAFAEWLQSKLDDVVVEPRWPSPDKKKPPKSITLVQAGHRRDTPIDLHQLSYTNLGAKRSTVVWQLAACVQPLQLDVWALNDVALDDVMARLDDLLRAGESSLDGVFNPNPVGTGNLIAVRDGWESCGTIADFVFEEPNLETSSDAVGRSVYRATYRGNAYFMLTVTNVTARQTAINFTLRLSETSPPEDFSVTPITS